MGVREKIEEKRRERERLELRLKEEKREREKLDERIEELNEKLDLIRGEKEEIVLVASKLELVLEKMEKNRIHEYIDLIGNKKKLLYINFLVGIGRGLGTLIGVTVITAFLIYIMQKIISLNIPLIGDIVTDIVRIVQENLGNV